MKTLRNLLGALALLGILTVIAFALLMPWMDHWGATDAEFAASYPGDSLVPSPAVTYTRAVTIDAAPEAVFPWLVQMGAEKGGMYSYSWFETNILQCELINADRIHPEWQDLKAGDKVKMCPGEDWGPPAYEVALIEPNQALVIGHQENGAWSDVWQFILVPQTGGTTRLILRSRDMKSGGIWNVIRPGEFIMVRGMLLGIKERLGQTGPVAQAPAATPTPEVFIPLDPSPTPSGSDLPLTCQVTDLNVYIDRAAGYCLAYPLDFNLGDQPSDKSDIRGPAIGSGVEPVYATLSIEVTPLENGKSLQEQAETFIRDFSVVDPATMTWEQVTVGGEKGWMVEPVPVMLSWRIVFVAHNGSLYRLMYWPVDVPEAKADLDELTQTTLGSFAFISLTQPD
ncbi:MAG: hypothetical protein EHM70_13150 [Chloroflexota bacterium]|nr:MAG: hypothetical protein EHM70_13150 [Chloroflexota bacterium]